MAISCSRSVSHRLGAIVVRFEPLLGLEDFTPNPAHSGHLAFHLAQHSAYGQGSQHRHHRRLGISKLCQDPHIACHRIASFCFGSIECFHHLCRLRFEASLIEASIDIMVKCTQLVLKSDGAYPPVDKSRLKMATKLDLRARANGTYPGPVRKPQALNTLAGHCIFNDRAVTNWVWNGAGGRMDIVQYYKNKGCTWENLNRSASYLLHTTAAERADLWSCLAEGSSSIPNTMELIETFRDYRSMLKQENDDVVRHGWGPGG